MQELGKLKCYTKRIRPLVHNKLVLIDSFWFLSFAFDSLVKHSGGNDSKHLSQEFDSEVLDLVKQKVF